MVSGSEAQTSQQKSLAEKAEQLMASRKQRAEEKTKESTRDQILFPRSHPVDPLGHTRNLGDFLI